MKHTKTLLYYVTKVLRGKCLCLSHTERVAWKMFPHGTCIIGILPDNSSDDI